MFLTCSPINQLICVHFFNINLKFLLFKLFDSCIIIIIIIISISITSITIIYKFFYLEMDDQINFTLNDIFDYFAIKDGKVVYSEIVTYFKHALSNPITQGKSK